MHQLERCFDAVGARGWLHVRNVDDPREVAFGADEPVVLSSVFKVFLLTEYARQVAAGQLDERERVWARDADRLGGLGVAGCADDVEMSLRDLAMFMMSLSDNTAADLVLERVGLDNVRALAAELGLSHTNLVGGLRELLRSMVEDTGDDFAKVFPTLGIEQLRTMRAFDPARTTSSTPRDLTSLLAAVWRDEAGPPQACAKVRGLMSLPQANWQRLASGFPDDVKVAAKSGTLVYLRQSVGVLEYPNGSRWAVAVFTAAADLASRRLDIESVIGEAARIAVDYLDR